MTREPSVSLTGEHHAFVDLLCGRLEGGELERAALRELLARRREGVFVPAKGMDRRLFRVIAARRRSHGLPS